MLYPLFVAPEAELELEQAVNWYNEQRAGLGYEFLEAVEEVFDCIRKTPELHAISYRASRLALIKRFPYVVCYLFDNEKVSVLAVFHGYRKPDTWKSRVT